MFCYCAQDYWKEVLRRLDRIDGRLGKLERGLEKLAGGMVGVQVGEVKEECENPESRKFQVCKCNHVTHLFYFCTYFLIVFDCHNVFYT